MPPAEQTDKLAKRLAHILHLVGNDLPVDKHALAAEYGVSVRAVERNLADSLANIIERVGKGRYRYKDPQGSGRLPAHVLHDYAVLTDTQGAFPNPPATQQQFILRQTTGEKPRPYLVRSHNYEDLRSIYPYFQELETAIREHHECRFSYKNKTRRVLPYRCVQKNGVWYLRAVELGEGSAKLKTYSIYLIRGLMRDASAPFQADPAIHQQIDADKDIWSGEAQYRVTIAVNTAVAHYFKRRALLPAQELCAEAEDGSLTLAATIAHADQILPLIRYWMPHLRIFHAPEELQLQTQLRQSVEAWLALDLSATSRSS